MPRIKPLYAFLLIAAAITAGAMIDHGIGQWNSPKQSGNSTQPSVVASLLIPESSPVVTASAPSPAAKVNATAMKTLAAILGERDPRQRTSDLEAFVNRLSPNEFADALKRMRRISNNSDRELASRLLVARWVQTDPEAAFSFANSNRGFEYIAEDVFQADAAVDLQGALNRAKEIPDSDMRYMALRGVLSFMADTDPASALALAQSLGDFPGNEALSSVIYRQWATDDPQSAALQAMQDATGGNPWQSPISQVARAWATQDPAAAADWAISLTDPNAEGRTISQVMRQWAREDMTAAANWVNALPQGAAYDSAAAALAFSMAGNDPQDAVSWAEGRFSRICLA